MNETKKNHAQDELRIGSPMTIYVVNEHFTKRDIRYAVGYFDAYEEAASRCLPGNQIRFYEIVQVETG